MSSHASLPLAGEWIEDTDSFVCTPRSHELVCGTPVAAQDPLCVTLKL
jgi:hypothetical protein